MKTGFEKRKRNTKDKLKTLLSQIWLWRVVFHLLMNALSLENNTKHSITLFLIERVTLSCNSVHLSREADFVHPTRQKKQQALFFGLKAFLTIISTTAELNNLHSSKSHIIQVMHCLYTFHHEKIFFSNDLLFFPFFCSLFQITNFS